MRCPNCGANLIYNEANRTYQCEYCGFTEVAVEKVVEKIVYKEASPEASYNLVIMNTSQYAFSKIQYRINDANLVGFIDQNETKAFKLVPGPHQVIFHYGKVVEKFLIVILENGQPVKINFKGRGSNSTTSFVIDQPYAGEEYKNLVNGRFPSTTSALSIVAFILSLSIVFSLVGWILGIIDVSAARKQNRVPSILSVMAIVFGLLLWMLGLPMMFGLLVK